MPTENVPQSQSSVNVNPQISPDNAEYHSLYATATALGAEDRLIAAAVTYLRAREAAMAVGRDCSRMEYEYAKGKRVESSIYLEASRAYRKALAEMSAARYSLVLELGW